VQALGASERVFQLLDRQPQQDLNGGTLRPLGAPEGSELRLQASRLPAHSKQAALPQP
jgi:hypothetical protein